MDTVFLNIIMSKIPENLVFCQQYSLTLGGGGGGGEELTISITDKTKSNEAVERIGVGNKLKNVLLLFYRFI